MKRLVFIITLLAFFSLANTQSLRINYLNPRAGSQQVNPASSVIIRFNRPLSMEEMESFRFQLSSTDKDYTFTTTSTEGGQTLIIRPDDPFLAGAVKVSLSSELLETPVRNYSFRVTKNTWNEKVREFASDFPESRSEVKPKAAVTTTAEEPTVIHGVVVPDDFPSFTPTLIGETAPGKIFLGNFTGPPYILILKNDGTPYFFQKLDDTSIDFKLQPTGVLTRRLIEDVYGFVSMDSSYSTVDTFLCDNGYFTDQHDLQLLENGHALLIASESRTIDMSQLVEGGNPAAEVIGEHIQEIDENGNAVFEFKSWDNFEILDAYDVDFTASEIDYVHANSVAVDADGNLLMSSRHLSECTKINRETGEIMWRLGGRHNQFTLVNEEDTIDYQHDIRPVPGVPGNYTIFDNGNHRGYSRVVEYQIDTVAMTATKVWEYRLDPDGLNISMGNAQRLPNGNTMINWATAGLPKALEVTPAGEIVYNGNFTTPTAGYRTFRFDWDVPAKHPSLILENKMTSVRLLYNVFGADTIAYYNIYGDTLSEPGEIIATTTEPWIDLSDLESQKTYYFRVTAVDTNGVESDFSNEEKVLVIRPEEGVNLIRNGDFSMDEEYWEMYLYDAEATTLVDENGEMKFAITDGGTMDVSVQLRQNNIPLINGNNYLFEFDAYSTADRSIVAKVGQDVYPYTNYSGIGTTNLSSEPTHYNYTFTMNSPTDYNSRVVVNCGANDQDVFIDNLSLKMIPADGTHELEGDDIQILSYPNPADEELYLVLPGSVNGNVELCFYSMDGRIISVERYNIIDNTNSLRVDIGSLDPGIYLCRITCSNADQGTRQYVKQIIKSPEHY